MFGFCIIRILNTECAKIWKKIRRQKVKVFNRKDWKTTQGLKTEHPVFGRNLIPVPFLYEAEILTERLFQENLFCNTNLKHTTRNHILYSFEVWHTEKCLRQYLYRTCSRPWVFAACILYIFLLWRLQSYLQSYIEHHFLVLKEMGVQTGRPVYAEHGTQPNLRNRKLHRFRTCYCNPNLILHPVILFTKKET